MPSGIVVKKDIWKAIRANLSLAKNSYVAVGYPGESNKATKKHDAITGMSNIEVAVANELGSAPGVIPKVPARPFMRRTFEREGPNMQKGLKTLLDMIATGRMTTKVALERMGRIGQTEVQRSFTVEKFAANAPMTIRLKGSSQPLIDKGTLRNSVSYKVRMKSGVR